MTRRAVADAFAGGSQWRWLEASTADLAAYRALGFQAIERQQCWVSRP
jgi:hypothetical protein